jgi:predicted enzyme related to lactoylglutathione lyase
MPNKIKFVHTNVIARDWQKLAQFYIDVFECKPLYPERDLKGEWINKLTNISNVHLKGIHLSLPGFKNGPTLEIFGYNVPENRDKHPLVNAQGFGHIAFHVDNVEAVLEKLLSNGGSKYGEMVEKEIDGVGFIKVIYAKDPEGNIIEIQNWRQKKA